jgi:selenocysteine-specific translation elongation factor
VVITLVGNKADLLDHAERAVPLNDVESLVKEFSHFQYFETSAFYGTGIVQLFTEIGKIQK